MPTDRFQIPIVEEIPRTFSLTADDLDSDSDARPALSDDDDSEEERPLKRPKLAPVRLYHFVHFPS